MKNPSNEKPTNGSSPKSKPLRSKTTSVGVKREKNGPTVVHPVYFKSLIVRNVRCFGDEPQTLNLTTPDGKQWAKWTIILGNNGTGKSTLLQLLDCISIQTKFFEIAPDSLTLDSTTLLLFDEPMRSSKSTFPRAFADDVERANDEETAIFGFEMPFNKRRSFAQFEFTIGNQESRGAANFQKN
jgi:hypothetical protein